MCWRRRLRLDGPALLFQHRQVLPLSVDSVLDCYTWSAPAGRGTALAAKLPRLTRLAAIILDSSSTAIFLSPTMRPAFLDWLNADNVRRSDVWWTEVTRYWCAEFCELATGNEISNKSDLLLPVFHSRSTSTVFMDVSIMMKIVTPLVVGLYPSKRGAWSRGWLGKTASWH